MVTLFGLEKWRQMSLGFCSSDLCSGTRDRELLELCQGRLRVDIRKSFFPQSGGRALSRLPREWEQPQGLKERVANSQVQGGDVRLSWAGPGVGFRDP